MKFKLIDPAKQKKNTQNKKRVLRQKNKRRSRKPATNTRFY